MNATTKKLAYEFLGDPLSSVTRATKRALFVFSVIGLLVGYTGVLPEDASVFGFKFPGLTQTFVELSLFALLVYHFIIFIIYIVSDLARFRIARDKYSQSMAIEVSDATSTPPDDEEEFNKDEFRRDTGYVEEFVPHSLIITVGRLKLIFDFAFPLVFGLGSIVYFFSKRLW